MKPITVLIPTAHQPKLLETALRSVARQSAVEQIHEVLVSENLMDRESEAVCKRFKELPIRYIFQDPPVSKVQHFNYLYDQAKADLVAVLCEDDWWGPGHLQRSIEGLKANCKAVAWASACLHVSVDTPWTGVVPRSPIIWIIGGQPGVCETWCLTSQQVLAAAWVQTPFHISTMVIRRPALQQVLSHLADQHSYQDDRMLQVQLGTLGMILYEPVVDTSVLMHPSALTWQASRAEREREFRKCTAMIWDHCEKRGVDLVSIWQKSLTGLGGPILEDVGTAFRMALNEKELSGHGFHQFLLAHPLVRVARRVRTIVKNRLNRYKPAACKSLGLARRHPSQ